MIRRDVAPPSAWILISQIDHARLAAQLAEHWGAGEFPPLWPAAELLWAIKHHDDGWRDWDLTPAVDPTSGQPRSFTEMVPADSLAIWTASIETARQAGPLETYVVAGHFCVLARRVIGWLDEETRRDLVGPFLATHDRLMADCLSQWRAHDSQRNTPAAADLALAQLQFFDALSLWFCCSPSSETETVQAPAGPLLTLVPRSAEIVEVDPWPWRVPRLDVEIEGRQVATGRNQSRQELAACSTQSARLSWQLHPRPVKS
jgi:hypothetical protein